MRVVEAAAPPGGRWVAAASGVLVTEGREGEEALVQRRPASAAFYPRFWEFPGGKVEAGEAPAAAVARELGEEVGVRVAEAEVAPWVVRRYVYPHAAVVLHVFRVRAWEGAAAAREGQVLQWRAVAAAAPRPLLPANGCLWKWLRLPAVCAVSAAAVMGVGAAIAALPAAAARAGGGGLLLQLRDKGLGRGDRVLLGRAFARMRDEAGGVFVVNDDAALAREVGADGVHLSSARLMRVRGRPRFRWVGASCHSAAQLARVGALGLDYALLSPVCRTLSHVAAAPLGWEGFAALAGGAAVPVFALGGLGWGDAAAARARGAHGVAMMRRAWMD